MEEQKTNDNQSDTKPKKEVFGGIFLSPRDIAIVIFSSLIINIFSLAVPLVTLQVYDRILSMQSIGTLQVLTTGVVVIVMLDIILKLLRSSLIGWTSARYEHHSSIQVLHHLMETKQKHLRNFSSGELLQRLSAISKLKSFQSGQSLINLIDLPFVLIFLGFIFYLSSGLVLIPIALLAIFSIYAVVLGKSMKKALIIKDEADDTRINFISEILSKIHTVKMLGLESAFQRRHEDLQNQNIHDSHLLSAKNAQGLNAASLFTQIMMILMISAGSIMVLDGQITMGVLIACVLLSGRIMQPVQYTLSFWISFQEYQLAKKKINELLSLPEQNKVSKSALTKPVGKLELEKVTFGYRDDKQIFKDLSFSLPNGKAIALRGPAGDGKTTLLKLIAGLEEPTSGSVKIDGIETSQIPADDLPSYIGYLPSESYIFQGTIMENLTGFRPEKKKEALEIASYLGIDKVISKLASGYETQLFDGPADPITPGMKQRITIGRVLVNKPRLILFDFADKSLDKEGYNHVFRFLGKIKGQASMILSSNDENILFLAQEEYVIEDKKIVPIKKSAYSKSNDVVQPLQELRS